MSFWDTLSYPIVGLSPMDGVTDAAFRFIAAQYGGPDVIFTEFTNVGGICRGPANLLRDFLYHEIERPIVAQIYGSDPEHFYKTARLVCALGFDGVDINMGCPSKTVATNGCGAALIRNPDLAKQIIRETRRGIQGWVEGSSLDTLGFRPETVEQVARMNRERSESPSPASRRVIPISIKTRIGYDSIVIEEWISHLLEERPAAISIHGRTLKQMYRGGADWNAIARAVSIAKGSGTRILGNGDLQSLNDAAAKILETGVDGVLIGRAALGNPWIFRGKASLREAGAERSRRIFEEKSARSDERLDVLLEHARVFNRLFGPRRFVVMRKHMGWYCKGFPNAKEWRARVVRAENLQEVEAVVAGIPCG